MYKKNNNHKNLIRPVVIIQTNIKTNTYEVVLVEPSYCGISMLLETTSDVEDVIAMASDLVIVIVPLLCNQSMLSDIHIPLSFPHETPPLVLLASKSILVNFRHMAHVT